MDSTRFRFQFGVAGILLVGLFCGSAFADRSYLLAVPQMDPARPAPVVDGVHGSLEYEGAWRLSLILYRPRAAFDSVRFSVIANSANLYICIPRMPRHLGTVDPFVSVVFDVDHDGGRFADNDDVRFTVSETGTREFSRGNGAGDFTTETAIGWRAVAAVEDDFYWTAEMQIPLELIGGAEPGTVIGLHIRHNWLGFQGDDYSWPPTAGWNVPNTWGDLLWLGRGTGEILVDIARITQGLDVDLDAGVFYDLVAGKDTLVWAQLYSPSLPRDLTMAELRVERIRPSPALVGTDVSISLSPRLAPTPQGVFDGLRLLRYWVPGSWTGQPGIYRFTVRVFLAGVSSPIDVRLATKTFQPTNKLNLLLVPLDERPRVPNSRAWGGDLVGVIPPALNEVQRILPLRAGVRMFLSFRRPSPDGLRYLFLPEILTCNPSEDPYRECGPRARAEANDQLHHLNAYLNSIDPAGVLDRFDFHVVLGASTGTIGGKAFLNFDPPSAGAGFDMDPGGGSPALIAHEVAHCLGEVPPSSPHHLPPQDHSRNSAIAAVRGFKAANMLTRNFVNNASSLMFPSVDNAPVSFIEGYEWNDVRRALLALPTRVSAERQVSEATGPLFRLVGLIDVQDRISVIYSKRLDDLPMDPTVGDPGDPYRIRFLDVNLTELGSYPFQVGYETLDSADPVTNTALLLAVPLPAGSSRVEILDGGNLIWGMDFSDQPPVVSNVVATDLGQGGVDLTWNAVDPDSQELRYNIYFTRGEDGAITPTLPLLVATGLTDTSFFFPFDMVPATDEGRLTVEATDGLNVAVGVTDPYVVPDRPPVAAIAYPSSTTALVALQPVILRGSAFDFTVGSLSDEALEWRSDKDGALGAGGQLEAALTAGNHHLTLKATAPSSLTAEAFVDVAVLADSDGDGLPDLYEAQQACLDAQTADSDQDPDGDGLSSLMEWQIGTNPCNPDSDVDGIADADEFHLNGDPLDPNTQPLPDLLFVPDVLADLGSSDNAISDTLTVLTGPVNLGWRIAADSSWIMTSSEAGVGDGQVSVWADPTAGLTDGTHLGKLLVTAEGSQPVLIEARFRVPGISGSRRSWELYR